MWIACVCAYVSVSACVCACIRMCLVYMLVQVNSTVQCGGVVRYCSTPSRAILLLTSLLLCSLSTRKLTMSTTSLPAGDNLSPTALAETLTNTQHTVTGECVHISCCTSEAMAVMHVPILQTVM